MAETDNTPHPFLIWLALWTAVLLTKVSGRACELATRLIDWAEPRPMTTGDAALLAAEHRLRVLRGQARAVYAAHPQMTIEDEKTLVCDVFDDEIYALEDLIEATAPLTLAGAAVKLRRLVAEDGRVRMTGDCAANSLAQVLALLDRLIREE